MPILDAHSWEHFLTQYPNAHILQSAAWGDLKAGFGWQPVRVVSAGGKSGAQILLRRLPFGLRVGYIPKGPLGSGWGALWPDIIRVCRQHQAVFLKIEPDAWENELPPGEDLPAGALTARPIQPRRTVEIELDGAEEDWLARMKPKTRYNIRLAERKGVKVSQSEDISLFHRLSLETGQRDGFGVHSQAYFQRAYNLFAPRGDCVLLVAEYDIRPLAALMAFAHGRRAWYFYGASSDQERNRMPTYLLQWEAIRWAAARGCRIYDLWGIPDEDEDTLEKHFDHRDDGLWGVYRFKRGFGGRVRRSAGAWDLVFNPILYRIYLYYTRSRGGDGGA